MLDPIQTSALAKARISGIRVSGIAGSGKSTLAAALASDAALRGLQCLLFNAPAHLAKPVSLPSAPHRTPSTLRARFLDGAVAAVPPSGSHPTEPHDPVSLRAALDPEGAALALRLLGTARQVSARHGLRADEVEALARPFAVSEEALARLGLALDDARTFADAALGGNERPGATFAAVRDLACGPVPADGLAALLLADTDAPLEAHLSGLAAQQEGAALAAGELVKLAEAMGDLVNQGGTVRETYAWARECARALDVAITLLQDHPDLAAALSTCRPDSPEAKVVGWCVANRNDKAAAIRACRKLAGQHEAQVAAVQPFLAEHGDRSCAEVRDATLSAPAATGHASDLGAKAHALRAGRHAARRFREALPILKDTLPAGMLASLNDVPVDEAVVPTLSGPAPERLRAADTLRALRAEFARLGYGDVLDPPADFEARVRGAKRPSGRTAGTVRPVPAEVLDLLLPDAEPALASPTAEDWARFVMHVAPAAPESTPPDLLELEKLGFDVVVVDDAHLLPAETLQVLRRCAPVVHETGAPLAPGTLHLGRSHRQATTGLRALVPDGMPTFLGGPSNGGFIVRTWAPADRIDPRHAARYLELEAVRAGLSVAVLDGLQAEADPGEHDVIIVHGASPLVAARRVAVHARLAVVACGQGLVHEVPPAPVPGAETAGLAALGWELVESACDGRVYARDTTKAVLAAEPHWLDRSDEDLLSRLSRLKALGWKPVVAWDGSERNAEETAAILAANEVRSGPDLRALLGGDLPRRPEIERVPAREIPFPEMRMSPDDVIRWRLRYLRDEFLTPATPYVHPERCILRDEMIEAILKATLTERAHFTRLPADLRNGTDGCQMPVFKTILDIKEGLPGQGALRPDQPMLPAVFETDAKIPPAHMLPSIAQEAPRSVL